MVVRAIEDVGQATRVACDACLFFVVFTSWRMRCKSMRSSTAASVWAYIAHSGQVLPHAPITNVLLVRSPTFPLVLTIISPSFRSVINIDPDHFMASQVDDHYLYPPGDENNPGARSWETGPENDACACGNRTRRSAKRKVDAPELLSGSSADATRSKRFVAPGGAMGEEQAARVAATAPFASACRSCCTRREWLDSCSVQLLVVACSQVTFWWLLAFLQEKGGPVTTQVTVAHVRLDVPFFRLKVHVELTILRVGSGFLCDSNDKQHKQGQTLIGRWRNSASFVA